MLMYGGAVLLLITGRMGIPNLYSFSWALRLVGACFFCITCFIWRLSTECPRRNVKYFGRVFLMLNYTDITQNTYIQS